MTDLPDVKLRALTNFPVRVTGRTAIDIEKTNGQYYIDLDVSGLVQNPNISAEQVDQSHMIIWNEVLNAYQLVPYALAATSGVSEIDGHTGALDIGQGLQFTGDTLEVDAGDGLQFDGDTLEIVPREAATKVAMAALDTAVNTRINLTESGCQGVFTLETYATYSSEVTADTQEGIFVRSTFDATKVWVREGYDTAEWQWTWFGIVGQLDLVSPSLHAEINAYLAIADIVEPAMTYMGPGIFNLTARINTAAHQWGLRGARSGGQQTILYKRYVEADAFLGVLSTGAWGFCWRDFDIRADTSIDRGGSAHSHILPGGPAQIGSSIISDVNTSGGRGFNYGVVFDGSLNTTVGGPCFRDLFWSNCENFGAKIACCYARSLYTPTINGVNLKASIGAGASTKALILLGTSSATSTNVHWNGFIGGEVDLDYLTRWSFHSPIESNITNTANVTDGLWVGYYLAGTVQNNWVACRTITNVNSDWEVLAADYPLNATYMEYSGLGAYTRLMLTGRLTPDTDGQNLYLRIGSGTVDSGASDYNYQHARAAAAAASGASSAAAAALVVSPSGIGNATGEGIAFELVVEDLNVVGYTWVHGRTFMVLDTGAVMSSVFGGQRLEVAAHDIVRLVMASGTLTGSVVLKGMRV